MCKYASTLCMYKYIMDLCLHIYYDACKFDFSVFIRINVSEVGVKIDFKQQNSSFKNVQKYKIQVIKFYLK